MPFAAVARQQSSLPSPPLLLRCCVWDLANITHNATHIISEICCRVATLSLSLSIGVLLVIFILFHFIFFSMVINPGDQFSHFVLIKFRCFIFFNVINKYPAPNRFQLVFGHFDWLESERSFYFAVSRLLTWCLCLRDHHSNDGAPHALQLYYTFIWVRACAYIYGSVCVNVCAIYSLYWPKTERRKRKNWLTK